MTSTKALKVNEAGHAELARRLCTYGHVQPNSSSAILLSAYDESIDIAALAEGIASKLNDRVEGNIKVVGSGTAAELAQERERNRVVLIAGGDLDDDATLTLGPLADSRLLVLNLSRMTESRLSEVKRELDIHVLSFDGFLAVGHRDFLPAWAQDLVN